MSLIIVNFKKNMNIFIMLMRLLNNDKVIIIIDNIKSVYKMIYKKIKTLHKTIRNYQNKKKKNNILIKKKKKIFL